MACPAPHIDVIILPPTTTRDTNNTSGENNTYGNAYGNSYGNTHGDTTQGGERDDSSWQQDTPLDVRTRASDGDAVSTTTKARLTSATDIAIHSFQTKNQHPTPHFPSHAPTSSTKARAYGSGTRASSTDSSRANTGVFRGHVACLSLLLEYGFPVLQISLQTLIPRSRPLFYLHLTRILI